MLCLRLCFLQNPFNHASYKELDIFNIELAIQITLQLSGPFLLSSLCITVIKSSHRFSAVTVKARV